MLKLELPKNPKSLALLTIVCLAVSLLMFLWIVEEGICKIAGIPVEAVVTQGRQGRNLPLTYSYEMEGQGYSDNNRTTTMAIKTGDKVRIKVIDLIGKKTCLENSFGQMGHYVIWMLFSLSSAVFCFRKFKQAKQTS